MKTQSLTEKRLYDEMNQAIDIAIEKNGLTYDVIKHTLKCIDWHLIGSCEQVYHERLKSGEIVDINFMQEEKQLKVI